MRSSETDINTSMCMRARAHTHTHTHMHAHNIHIVSFGTVNPYFLHMSALPFVDTFLNMKCIVFFFTFVVRP